MTTADIILRNPRDMAIIAQLEDRNYIVLKRFWGSLPEHLWRELKSFGTSHYYEIEAQRISINPGLRSDLATGVWPFFQRDRFLEPSIIHDALYQEYRRREKLGYDAGHLKRFRKLADRILRYHLRNYKPRVVRPLRWIIYRVVRRFGWAVLATEKIKNNPGKAKAIINTVRIVLLIGAILILLSACAHTLDWDTRVTVYDLHHERYPAIDSDAKIRQTLIDRGVPDAEIEQAIVLYKSIQHRGE